MIKFFRKIRQNLLRENKTSKYFKYAIGEIVLVVIGILIALQINNWNEERLQAEELDGLMKSISSAIKSDVHYLNLIRTARENIGIDADSVFSSIINMENKSLVFDEYAHVSNTFTKLNTDIYFQPNTSSFEALKNSIYLSKLQGTDIESLLHTYYAGVERIQNQEGDYNQILKDDYQAWSNKFRNKGKALFEFPWNHANTMEKQSLYFEILNDESTIGLLVKGFEESNMIGSYDRQIMLGEKYIEMVNNQEVNFSQQTKIEFSSILNSYAEVNILNLLVKDKIPSNFQLIYAQPGDKYFEGVFIEEDYFVITYPENTFEWGSPYFRIEALNGRVTEMDFSKYHNVTLEMKGEQGGEEFALMMKDKYDPPDGKESRVDIKLTKSWQTFEVPINQFETADKKIIRTPLGFVFLGNKGVSIHVKSIQFK